MMTSSNERTEFYSVKIMSLSNII